MYLRWSRIYGGRTFSVRNFVRGARTLSMRVGILDLIEMNHISLFGDFKKAEAFQLAELVVKSGSRHPDFFLHGSGRQTKLVLVLVGRKIYI